MNTSSLFRPEALEAYQRRLGSDSHQAPSPIRFPVWIWIVVAVLVVLITCVLSLLRVPIYVPVTIQGSAEQTLQLSVTDGAEDQLSDDIDELVAGNEIYQGQLTGSQNEDEQLIFILETSLDESVISENAHLHAGSKPVGIWLLDPLRSGFAE